MCMAHQGGEEKHMNLASSAGYCYSDVSSHMANHHLQSFESNPEIYNLTTGMEIIGFPPKSLHQQTLFAKAGAGAGNHDPGGGPPSSSKTINESTGEFYGMSDTAEALMVAPDQSAVAAWQDQNRLLAYDSSMRCVFPCEGNERPSQGLSLSLSSTNPSTIRVQSFELRQQDNNIRPDGFFGKSMNIQQQMIQQDHGFFGKASNVHHLGHFQIRNSKYLGPAQELLNEFCNLGTKQTDPKLKIKPQKTQYWQDENASSSSKKQSLYSLDLLELQKRKTKLLSMLEELDRRYRHYCDQMKAVVSSFEAVAGSGAATVYSALASKAMSRHFRCLRDGIVNQIKAAKKAMGEKDTVAPGTTKGETPRLRLLDQTLRQQKAFQQMNLMESHPWRPQRGLPERSVSLLRAWLFEHFLHPESKLSSNQKETVFAASHVLMLLFHSSSPNHLARKNKFFFGSFCPPSFRIPVFQLAYCFQSSICTFIYIHIYAFSLMFWILLRPLFYICVDLILLPTYIYRTHLSFSLSL
ncbi:homeobox protein BEL1 homolog isoform X2 [Diospyros lotus]|uniref:homeobox protein BEL1 homolog isoform X2 n=1 Tax=Diospyros lotus TaxID=55363 RepID=UPI0022541970|nr:homeobox protein BEL1 homolog isoform X2 [Diospyros lotus]